MLCCLMRYNRLMNKKTLAIYALAGLIIFSIAIGAVTLFSSQALKTNSTTSSQTPPASTVTSPTMATDGSDMAHTTPGMYMTYDQSSYDAHANQRRVLFFHAPWCPQCVALDKDIAASDLPDDVAIFKVDYDSNQELRKKYGVTLQTTFVLVDTNGEQVKKYTAYATPNYASVKTNLLD